MSLQGMLLESEVTRIEEAIVSKKKALANNAVVFP